MTRTLLSIPNEILVAVTNELTTRQDTFAFAQTNHRLHQVVMAHIYRYNVRNEDYSALIWAEKQGLQSMVQRYIEATKTFTPSRAATARALESACKYGHESIVDLFISSGAMDRSGWAYMPSAARFGHTGIVKKYLNHFPDAINSYDEWGKTALHRAAMAGHFDIAQLLLQTDPACKVALTRKGDTALHCASMRGQDKIIELLIQNGADMLALNDDKRTPLAEAARGNHASTVRLLLDYEEKLDLSSPHKKEAWLAVLQSGRGDIAKVLFEHDRAGRKSIDSEDWTPLVVAIQKGRTDMADMFIAAGANVHTADSNGVTPLIAAAEHNNIPIVLRLIGCGADVNCKTKEGATALIEASSRGHSEIVEILLGHGADLGIVNDSDGETAIRAAARHGHVDIVQMLLEKGANAEGQSQIIAH